MTITQAKQLSDANGTGTILGQSSSDKIGFYGKTAITLRSLPASLTAANTTTTLKAAVSQIRNLLKNLGLGV